MKCDHFLNEYVELSMDRDGSYSSDGPLYCTLLYVHENLGGFGDSEEE